MSTGKWKGFRLGTQDGLPVLERIARQKDAAYVFLQQANIPAMVEKLKIVARMQDNYEGFTGREVPTLLDYECLNKHNLKIPSYATHDKEIGRRLTQSSEACQ